MTLSLVHNRINLNRLNITFSYVKTQKVNLRKGEWQCIHNFKLFLKFNRAFMPNTIKADFNNTKIAVVAIVFTSLILSLGDAIIKITSADLVLWQIFVLRSAVVIPILLTILRLRYRSLGLMPKAIGWTALRSLMLTFMWVAYYAALPNVELSIAAAALYTTPVFIALFSSWFAGERVGRAGWFAIFLGFLGTALILRPSAEDFNLYALLPVISAVLYALSMILTGTKCQDEHPLMLALSLNVSFIVIGLLATILSYAMGAPNPTSYLSSSWAPIGTDEMTVIILLALVIIVASTGAAIAYQIGRPSTVATFDFTYVGFAMVWSFIFFDDLPDRLSISGIALIIIAGVIATRR